MKRYALGFLLVAAAGLLTALLVACGSSDAIFYTLATERELIDERGMPDEINVFRMVYDSVHERVFAAAGTVYWRDLTADRWQVIAPPADLPGGVCNHIEYFGGDIVAWFYDPSNTNNNGLYTLDPAGAPPAGWTDVTTVAVAPTGLSLLREAGGSLFIAYQHAGGWRLYAENGTYTYATALTFPGAAADAADMIIDAQRSGDGLYWVATLPNDDDEWLYSTAAFGTELALAAGAPVVSQGRPAGGLYYHADGARLWASGQSGLIYYRPDGGAWTTPTGGAVEVDDRLVRFTTFERAETGFLVVGTQGQGYFRVAEGTTTQPHYADDRQPPYNVTGLYTGAVHAFLAVDSPVGGDDPDLLFACTYGNGLWRADYVGGTEVWRWFQE